MKIENGRVRLESRADLPLGAGSLGSTDGNLTGSWKYLEPFYRDGTPPCADRCPAGVDVVAMMRAVEAGRWDDAVHAVLAANPFPGLTGRACPHPCMQPCNRKALGGGIDVRAVERQVGDHKLRHGIRPPLPPTAGPAVHVLGPGPAGLAGAVALRRLGHPVVVHEEREEAGGVLRYGIPEFHLPVEVVRAEVAWVRDLGIEIRTGSKGPARGPVLAAREPGRPRDLGIPGAGLPGVHRGGEVLEAIRRGHPPALGDRVAVIGGGDTALDVARSLLRLGSAPVVHYRRSAREMPARREEFEEAKREGIEFLFQSDPSAIEPREGGGLRLRIGDRSADVDAVVAALGREPDPADPSPPFTDVAGAVRAGRLGAIALHESLEGRPLPPDHPLRSAADRDPGVVKFKDLNPAWFDREPPVAPPRLAAALRAGTFDAVEGGLTEEEARHEATRCFKCGTCTGCDTCLTFCPDFAIGRRPEGGYSVDLRYCKGCGVCAEECPRGALHLRRAP